LDFLSAFDQYVQAHVVYYNNEGVAVTHPIGTAEHYLKTSFVFDMFSWLPIEFLVYVNLTSPLSQRQWSFISVLRLNRMLQLSKVRYNANHAR